MSVKILGISAYYHDSAAALIIDGRPVYAAQEERFTRLKHDASFPLNAVNYCLEASGIALDDLDHIVFFEKPFLKFERLLETYLSRAPRGFLSFQKSIPVWIKEKLFQKHNIIDALSRFSENKSQISDKLLFAEHHQSHAASAFFRHPLMMLLCSQWTALVNGPPHQFASETAMRLSRKRKYTSPIP